MGCAHAGDEIPAFFTAVGELRLLRLARARGFEIADFRFQGCIDAGAAVR